jgi:predicted nucleic acid-binding protein
LENFARVPKSDVALPLIVVIEQMRGRYDAILKAEPRNLLKEQERLLAAETLLSEFEIFYLSEEAIKELQDLTQRVKTKKRYADVIIAAMARTARLTVVTRNVEDFKDLLPAARIQNWIDLNYSN